MKTTILILSLVLGAVKVSAQFFPPCNFTPNISPGMVMSMSPAQLEMAQNAHLAQIQAETNAMQMRTMQMMQERVATAAYNVMNFQFTPTMPMPVYNSVELSGSYRSEKDIDRPKPSPSSRITCSHCKGTGRMEYNTNPTQFGMDNAYKVKCNECGKEVLKSWGHTHVSCSNCNGRGTR